MQKQTFAIHAASMAVLVFLSSFSFLPATAEEAKPAATCPASSSDPHLKIAEQTFEGLHARSQQFAEELGRRKDADQTISVEQLIEQANAEKTFNLATPNGAQEKLSPEAIYARCKPAVVVVGGIYKCTKCEHWHAQCASGFVIQKDGLIITNWHVIDGLKKLAAAGVMTEDGRVFPIKEVLASSRRDDLALLKVEADDLKPLPIAKDISVGATVYCLAHPVISEGRVNCFYSFTQGMVAGKFTIQGDKQRGMKVLAVTADYGPGASGGPILNEQGAVVAVACQAVPLSKQEKEKNIVAMVWKFARPACNILPLLGQTEAEQASDGNRTP